MGYLAARLESGKQANKTLTLGEINKHFSISGVNQYFEISKRSHATLTSIDPNRTKVELYPTFAISVGCDFDFTLVLSKSFRGIHV